MVLRFWKDQVRVKAPEEQAGPGTPCPATATSGRAGGAWRVRAMSGTTGKDGTGKEKLFEVSLVRQVMADPGA